ncbi:MAG: leucine--tRNA ligase, partial [Salinivirgaceae bacterium]
EELWHVAGNEGSIVDAEFPAYDEKYLKQDEVTYPISFNGKTRFKLALPAEASKDDIEKAVMQHTNTQKYMEGKSPKKVIVVPKRIVNIVM